MKKIFENLCIFIFIIWFVSMVLVAYGIIPNLTLTELIELVNI